MENHKVGGEVDAACNKCKMTLAHTILAMVGPKIARVRCNTCNADHAYRRTSLTDRPPSARTKEPREKKVVISFEEQLAGKDVAGARTYSPQDTYAVGEVMRHPTFGVGLVQGVRADKIDVAFKADEKTLVHGRVGGSAPQRPSFRPAPTASSQPADKPSADAGAEDASEPSA